MKTVTLLLTTLAGSALALAAANPFAGASLEKRLSCEIPNLGCYNNRDCCGGLKCDFSDNCCLPDYDDQYGRKKRQDCGCCRK